MITEEQRTARCQFIGSSDAAAILGVDEFRTPLDVYRDKVNGVSDEPVDYFSPLYWGNVHEEVVIKAFEQYTGQQLVRSPPTIMHPTLGFMGANLDAMEIDREFIAEVKTTTDPAGWGDSFNNGVPDRVTIQVHHQMMCSQIRDARALVLIKGSDFRIMDIPYRPELAAVIIEKETEFWYNHVIPKIPPEPRNDADIKDLFSKTDGTEKKVTLEIFEALKERRLAAYQLSKYQQLKDELDFMIKTFMGESASLTDGHGNTLCTWKEFKRTALDIHDIKKNHPQFYAEHSVTKPYRKFTTEN